jgi:hypothetical protein
MTDFLSRLAAQTVHATPVVEPRRPSRHEPVARDDRTARFEPEVESVEPEVGSAEQIVRDDEIERVPRRTGDRVSSRVSDGPRDAEADLALGQPVDMSSPQSPTDTPRAPLPRVAARQVVDVLTGAEDAPRLTTPILAVPRVDPDARRPVDTGIEVVRMVERDEGWPEPGSTTEPRSSMVKRTVPATAIRLAAEADDAPMSPTEGSLQSPPLRQPPKRDPRDVGRDDLMVDLWQAEAIPSTGPRSTERVPAPPEPPSLPEPEIVATPVKGEGRPRADSPTLPEPGSFPLADHPWTVPDAASVTGPAGPPVVHVTIGRIEVKAAPPEARVTEPVRVPEPVAPALSLDDYLERRKVGWG